MACPKCSYANDEHFKFCQSCGFKRKPLQVSTPPAKRLKFPVREEILSARMDELNATKRETSYGKQKTSLGNELLGFLVQLSPPKDITSCSPKDIVKFLIWKDQAGKTPVHKINCPLVGHKKSTFKCGCPLRLAYGTIDSLIGKLRAIFNEHNRSGEWNPTLFIGNPASGCEVRQYLTDVRSEQLQARVTPTQARPFLLSHLLALCHFVHSKLVDMPSNPADIFVFARDQAYFKVLFYSGDRGGDIIHVKSSEILRFPDNSGLLFNHLWTKSLRNGDRNVFAFRRGKNPTSCPVTGLEMYLKVVSALGIDISKGYLFRALTKQGKVSEEPFSAAAAQSRLKCYSLELAQQWQGQNFTLHSFRNGCAVSLAILDTPLHQIMDHVGWKTSKQALHYIKLREVLNPAGPAAKLADCHGDFSEKFQQWNNLDHFLPLL